MAKLRIPSVLRPLVDGQPVVVVDAVTLADLQRSIAAAHPQLAARLFAPDGTLREFVTVFLGADDARQLDPGTALGPTTELLLLPAVSGG
ncbi:MAG TPA: molybdopterin synthase sulfur carrier subunit [Candidatus Limnocylindria bacterium]